MILLSFPAKKRDAMSENKFTKFGFDLRVIAAVILAAVAIGAINNALVSEDRQVSWSGRGIALDEGAAAPHEEDAEAGDEEPEEDAGSDEEDNAEEES